MARKYAWISTRANEEGTHATVQHWHSTQAQAKHFADTDYTGRGGYEGPVPLDMYPIGKVFKVAEEESA